MVVDTLSGRYTLLSVLEAKMLGFQIVKGLYKEDPNFKEVFKGVLKGGPYSLQQGYLFGEACCAYLEVQ